MPKGTMKEESAYPVPEDVLVPARLMGVSERVIPFTYKQGPKAGQPGEFSVWQWEFQVIDGEFTGMKLRGDTESEINNLEEPRGRSQLARPWVEALLGRTLAIGEEVDTDDLVALNCQVTVKHEDPRPKKEGGFFYPCPVDCVFPAVGSAMSVTRSTEPPF